MPKEFNPTQLLIIATKLKCSDEMTRALRLHLIEGEVVYSAEKKAGVYPGSLRKKVARVREELEFIEMFNQASTAEFQQSLDI